MDAHSSVPRRSRRMVPPSQLTVITTSPWGTMPDEAEDEVADVAAASLPFSSQPHENDDIMFPQLALSPEVGRTTTTRQNVDDDTPAGASRSCLSAQYFFAPSALLNLNSNDGAFPTQPVGSFPTPEDYGWSAASRTAAASSPTQKTRYDPPPTGAAAKLNVFGCLFPATMVGHTRTTTTATTPPRAKKQSSRALQSRSTRSMGHNSSNNNSNNSNNNNSDSSTLWGASKRLLCYRRSLEDDSTSPDLFRDDDDDDDYDDDALPLLGEYSQRSWSLETYQL